MVAGRGDKMKEEDEAGFSYFWPRRRKIRDSSFFRSRRLLQRIRIICLLCDFRSIIRFKKNEDGKDPTIFRTEERLKKRDSSIYGFEDRRRGFVDFSVSKNALCLRFSKSRVRRNIPSSIFDIRSRCSKNLPAG